MRLQFALRPALLTFVGSCGALVACSGGGGQPVAPIRGAIGATPTPTSTPSTAPATATPSPSATPVVSPTPKPSATATAAPTPTATATSTATPVPTATPTAIANCGSPIPAGPSHLYEAAEFAVTIYAGNFTGTSTSEIGIGSDELGLGTPFGVGVGPNGNVYTLENLQGAQSNSASVAEYPPNFGCTAPIAILNGLPNNSATVGQIAVDAAGYVYVASQVPRQLALYAPLVAGAHSPQPLSTVAIPSGSENPDGDPLGIALDASGRIYLSGGYENAIYVYPARSGNSLSASPSATIKGSSTTFEETIGVTVDASGKIYVLDDTPAVKVFAANPSGPTNEAPIAQIVGSLTKIDFSPLSIAVDRLGVIYVGDIDTDGTILEFPANPTGTVNEAPQGILTSTGTPAELFAK